MWMYKTHIRAQMSIDFFFSLIGFFSFQQSQASLKILQFGGTVLTGCEVDYRMYCTTQEIEPIFYNCKWSVTFKIV